MTPYLKRLLRNALIQRHFDYACSACYINLNKKLESKLQTVQNRSIRYCLQLDNRNHIGVKHFEQINWLLISERFNQYLCSTAFKFLRKLSRYIFMIYTDSLVKIKQRSSVLKLKYSLKNTFSGHKNSSYLTPISLEQFADGPEVGEFT